MIQYSGDGSLQKLYSAGVPWAATAEYLSFIFQAGFEGIQMGFLYGNACINEGII
jgi:hypothetical protein